MCKKALLLSVFYLFSSVVSAQYEDDAPPAGRDTLRKQNTFSLKGNDRVYYGTEMMLTLSTGNFFAELSPFAAYKVIRPFHVGGGLHGGFLAASTVRGNINTTYYGAHAFARLVVGESFFLHSEMRLLNGVVDFNTGARKWVTSPIFGLGFSNGGISNSWVLLGYAPNVDFAAINPFGHFVYRLGFRF